MVRHVVVLGVIGVMGAACGDSTGTDDQVQNQNFVAEEALQFDLDATGRTTFRVEGINGNIDVVGAAGTEIFTVRGERQVWSESVVDAQDYLDRLEVVITETVDEILIRTVQPQNTGGRNLVVNYVLTVPERLATRLVNVNGNVTVRQVLGSVTIDDVNGNVTLDDLSGSVDVVLVNGNIACQAVIVATGTIDLETVNGNVTLDIPQNTSAEFAAHLVNGTITTSNLVFQNVTGGPTSLIGTLGNGQGMIDLRTVNGNILARGV
ncbi:MAG TPA: DUF4097 family beta strand repeat-containing protein [Gemmatimonadales bacterium]|nr:DUF4097 family beta strand repeat-containing protein [Gemmatimonadales bacterium]